MLSRRDFLKAAVVGTGLPFMPADTSPASPWVQNLCRGGASIVWRSLSPGPGTVEFSEDQGFYASVPADSREFPARETGLPQPFYLHRADLADLRPSTNYHYRVIMDGSLSTAAEGIRIRTGGWEPFDFVAFGDCGLGTNEQYRIAQRMLADNAALALITGDVVYMNGSYPEYEQRFFPYYAEMMRRVPFFPSPGNHDYGTQNLAPYLALHALPLEDAPLAEQGRYYSFDWGNVHFISLDSNATFMDAVHGKSRMLEWFEKDLERSDSFWRVVYFHHPPYTWGIHTEDRILGLLREHIVPLLDRYRVDLVLNGHEHSYQRTHPMRGGHVVNSPEGTVFVTTGGGGANLYPVFPGPGLAYGESAHHYVRAENRGARMTVRAIRIDGKEIDAFSLAPTPTVCAANLSPFDPERNLEWNTPVVAIHGRHLAAETRFATERPLPRTLGGTRVTHFGRPLPLFSVSDTKIVVQLPHRRQWARLRVENPNGWAETDVVFSETPPGPICR